MKTYPYLLFYIALTIFAMQNYRDYTLRKRGNNREHTNYTGSFFIATLGVIDQKCDRESSLNSFANLGDFATRWSRLLILYLHTMQNHSEGSTCLQEKLATCKSREFNPFFQLQYFFTPEGADGASPQMLAQFRMVYIKALLAEADKQMQEIQKAYTQVENISNNQDT